ncbi:class I SAM-dependent methyltransferase [Vibrio mimicus]
MLPQSYHTELESPTINGSGGIFPFAVLAEWLVAPVRLALLELAIYIELPDIIKHTNDLPGIAARLNTSRLDKLTYLLDALVASGMLQKENGRYRNAEFAENYLRKGQKAYLGELLLSLKDMQHRNIHQLKDFLFEDCEPIHSSQTLYGEDHRKRSARGIAEYQKAGAADAMATIVASLPKAETFHCMLDLGSGPGITALRILQRLLGLHIVLCDFPHVLQLAEQEINAAGMCERVSFIPGDYNCLDWGRNFDLIWACQSLYFANDLQHFMGRVFASLNPGGLFVSIHEGVCCENTKPAMLILSRLSLALEGQDVSFPKGRIAEAAAKAGFIRVQKASLPMLYGDADLEVFQKPSSMEAVC